MTTLKPTEVYQKGKLVSYVNNISVKLLFKNTLWVWLSGTEGEMTFRFLPVARWKLQGVTAAKETPAVFSLCCPIFCCNSHSF